MRRIKQRFCSVILGGGLLAIGLLFVWVGIPHTNSFTCKRITETQIDCQRQETVLWWIPIKTTSLKRLQAVQIGEGENAYDSTVYFLDLAGESRYLTFGNTLDRAEIQTDLVKTQQFLKDSNAQSLRLARYEANWIFAIVGLPIGGLGFWTLIYRYE